MVQVHVRATLSDFDCRFAIFDLLNVRLRMATNSCQSKIKTRKNPNFTVCLVQTRRQGGGRPEVIASGRLPGFSASVAEQSGTALVAQHTLVKTQPEAPSGLWCNRSISPREGDGPGATPGFLTNLDGPKLIDYPHQ